MSPYLFVLCMERFSQWITMQVAEGTWRPLRASRDSVPISHLLLVDDILLFAKVTVDQVICIKEGLHLFCKASDQSVNMNKSIIFFSPNLRAHVVSELSAKMGIQRTEDLGIYLGHRIWHIG